jgi:hypothetical protein
MIKTPELYEYIRLNNVAKIQEWLDQLDNVANKENLDKLQNLLAYAIDWKKLDIIKLLIEYSANPEMTNRFASYYMTQNTNAIPDLEIIAYLSEKQTLEEYVSTCSKCNSKECTCS